MAIELPGKAVWDSSLNHWLEVLSGGSRSSLDGTGGVVILLLLILLQLSCQKLNKPGVCGSPEMSQKVPSDYERVKWPFYVTFLHGCCSVLT